jgi:uncharacterized membrane protein
MSEHIFEFLEHAVALINLFAVIVIIIGFVVAAGKYVGNYSSLELQENFNEFKINLGHALTLGLELLVLSDVIESIIIKPTIQSLLVLAFLVIIRTFLSWNLALQIEGCWPWQNPVTDKGDGNA